MVFVTDPQEPSETEDGVVGFARDLIEHDVGDTSKLLSGRVVDGRAIHLAGRKEAAPGVPGIFDVGHVAPPINRLPSAQTGLSLESCAGSVSLGETRGDLPAPTGCPESRLAYQGSGAGRRIPFRNDPVGSL